MTNDLMLGIDVGTTSVKAGVFDASGTLAALFSERYKTQRGDNGIVEQNPGDWIVLIDKAIEQFRSQGLCSRIASVGLCSQVNTHVFIGGNGEPLLPAILWQDGRASEEAAALDAQISHEQKCRWWGAPMPIDASHLLPRMLWLQKHHPDLWKNTHRVLLPKDYCLYKLTGELSTDPLSNIGLVGADLNYIDEVLDLVPGAAHRMAPLLPITASAGKCKADTALAGLPVASGTMDAWAALIGAGGAQADSTVYLSGTSEILGICSSQVEPTPGAIVFPECEAIRLHAAPTQCGGDAAAWYAEATNLSLTKLDELVANTAHGSTTPLFLPQLEGERAPIWDSELRAAFLGVSRRTSHSDMARAVFEGVAFSARHALETLQLSARVNSSVASCGGGGFRSSSWAQIRADILQIPLKILKSSEPGVLGAAAIAATGAGIYANLEKASLALSKTNQEFHPDLKLSERYDERYELYKKAIEINADLGKNLAGIKA